MNSSPFNSPTSNAGFQRVQHQRRNINWNQSGIPTSVEQNLQFAHRFSELSAGLPNENVAATLPTEKRMSNAETNPVGALQERFQSRGIAPDFELIQSEGASHCPVFTYKVTVNSKTTTGTGNSKKLAKHAAAKAMLDLLDGIAAQNVGAPGQEDNSTSAIVQNDVKVPAEPGTNPIGELQEFCVKSGIPIPLYELGSIDGQPHKRQFIIVAKVGAAESSGSGTSKKEAKKRAAKSMLDKLTAIGADGARSITFSGNGNKNGLDEGFDFTNLSIEPLSQKQTKAMQNFFDNLDPMANKLQNLQHTPLLSRSGNFATMLNSLAAEQKFDVRFIEIEETTLNGEAQCLVQLSTLPVAVCFGVGQDHISAKNDAARNALYYLKIMTKKTTGNVLATSESNRSGPSMKK